MRPELLAPAGNLKKLKCAFHFGADAVYAGGKAFSLRAFADNFSDEELAEGIAYAHERGKKVYVAVNIFARNADFSALSDYFRLLEKSGPIYSTSVNISGERSLLSFEDVLSVFDGTLDFIVKGEGGKGSASTIVDMSQKPYRVVRMGAFDPRNLI